MKKKPLYIKDRENKTTQTEFIYNKNVITSVQIMSPINLVLIIQKK